MKKAILVSFVVILGTAVALQAEFKVNTYTTDDQEFPAIAMGAQGDFVVVWRSAKQDAGSRGTYGQRFDADGAPIGGEFKINTTSVGGRASTGPSVAMDSSGNFVVAWTGYRGDEENIIARRYNAGGSPITGEFVVNTQTHSAYINSHIGPTVAMNASGAFVIVWQAWHGDSSGHGTWCVYGRAYDINGVPRADEFMVTQLPHGSIPDVAMDESGDFVVAWRRDGNSNYPPMGRFVMCRMYNADGTPKGNAIQITGGNFTYFSSIAMNSSGSFIITWSYHPDWRQTNVYAQRFDSDGNPISAPFMVNTYTADMQGQSSAAMNDNGELVVVWLSQNQDGSSYGVFGQRYNSDGMPVDEEFQLNTYTLDNQWYPDISLSESGRFVVVWQSNGQDGSGEGIFAEFGQLPRQLTYYVDADATGANNGSGWADAFNDLQDALAVVLTGDEIRVGEGVYKPITYMPPPPPPPPLGSSNVEGSIEPAADRTATFHLKNGVVIKGGHAGFGEPVPDERDPNVYETVLSGDIGIAGFEGDNCYHVISSGWVDATAVLDGVTITGGNANEEYPSQQSCGGGMYNTFGSPTLINCTFTDNFSARDGGGMFNSEQSNPTIIGCVFRDNSSIYEGGAISNRTSSPTITNCSFIGNWSNHGGGISNWPGSPVVSECTFSGNSAELGGAVFNWDSSPKLTDCLFSSNSAREWGGGIANFSGSNPTLTNCAFSRNSAGQYGGGMYNTNSNPTLTSCTFSENSGSYYAGGMYNSNSSPILTNCTISGNRSQTQGSVGGMVNLNYSSPILINCILWANPMYSRSQIHNDGTSSAAISYSDVQGGWPGEGNINSDPRFVQPAYFGPIAYWKLDEASGTTAFDSAGSSHGSVYGALWTGGLVDGALSFDGFNDYVDIGENAALDGLSAITLEAWIYPERDSHWHILDKGDGDKRIYAEGTTLSLDGRVRYTGSHAFSRSVSNTVILNRWQHVALTWSSTDHTTRLYHNGVEVNYSIRSIGTGFVLDDRSHFWTIGARGALGEVTFFDGLIDEAAIHDRVLSSDEIREHYLAGLSGQGYPGIMMPDYHLLEDSPCINTGDPDYPFDPNERDLDGKPRVIAGRVDMGAYEFNHNPVADAGPDQTIEAQAPWGATVTLDGTGSSDADCTPGTFDDINAFNWYEADPCDPNADIFLGSGLIIDCNLSIGEHIIILEVIDRAGASDTDEVTILVQDTTSPTITCPGGERMVAYNDCVYLSGDQYIANNVTTYGIGSGFAGSTSGPLVDQATGGDMDIMITLTESGGVNWLPIPASGGSDCAKGTDAYNTFGGIADMTGVIYYGSAGWWIDLTFTGLNPATEYTFATSAARNSYSDRLTIYTLTGADTYTNASTIGVDVLAENKVRFNTGDNHNEGYVARWTGITATEGSFTVRAEADPCSADGRKAYSFDVFMLEGVLLGDVTLECPADTTPSATGKATATDTCGAVTITHSDQWQPSCGNTGTLARTWTATDEFGNSSTCVQIITVVDTTPPDINCPPDVTLEYPADTNVEANGSATASDTCGTVTITHSDQWQPDCGSTGILTRTWTATDECGNESSCMQTIKVVDTTPPEFEFSVSPTMLWPPNHKMAEITPTWTVSDECDPSPDVSLVSIVANEGDDIIGDGHTSDDIQIDDDGSIFVRSERSGTNTGRIYTITYQAVDDCGNATIRSATVSIPHDFKLLARMGERWLCRNHTGNIPEDLNGDGIVNLKDIAIFANNWIR